MKNLLNKLVVVSALLTLGTVGFIGCGTNTAQKVVEENIVANSKVNNTDSITNEVYPQEIKVGILNGSTIDAIASTEGYYEEFEKETGVKVSVYYFESGRDVNNAYASKSIDVATFGSSPISLGITNKLGYEVVYLNDLIGDIEALTVSSDIEDSKSLSGKTIATPFASTSHYCLLNYLERNSITDANVIDLEPQDILAAWQRGDIDGAYIWAPVLGELKKNGNVITTSAKLAEEGVITADITTANTEFGEKYPTLVTAFLDVQNKVYELIINDRDKALEDIEKVINLSNEEAVEQLDGQIWLSLEDQFDEKYLGKSGGKSGLAETIKSTAEFHLTQGNLEKTLELDEYINSVDSLYAEALLDK